MAIESGYCQCGCGLKTNVHRGESKTYRKGHYARVHPPKWSGGRIKRTGTPYFLIYAPGHLRADPSGYVREHILIAEKALGKPLPSGVVVHHHTPEQPVICQNQGYHLILHQRKRALEACGHANWLKCRFCKKHDAPKNMVVKQRSGREPGQIYAEHRDCRNQYEKDRRVKQLEVKKAVAKYEREFRG